MEAATAAIAAAAAAAAAARRRAADAAAAASAASAAAAAAAAASSEQQQSPRARALEQVSKRKAEMLDHLLRSMDIVAYCHFAYVYFMDTSLLRFLIRSITQINLFAQRAHHSLPTQRLNVRSSVFTIVAVTIFCLMFHIFGSAPFAGEASGGYLHGGLIIDFIGQETPISKYRLVFFDLLIMSLQLLMLTIKSARQEITDKLDRRFVPPPQDHDSEERGQNRTDEEDGLLDGEEGGPPEEHAANTMYSGEIVIADLNVLDTIRRQWRRNAEESRTRSAEMEEARQNLENRMRTLRQRWERRFGQRLGGGERLGGRPGAAGDTTTIASFGTSTA